MSVTLRLPEVWLAGIAGFGVYLAYTSMRFSDLLTRSACLAGIGHFDLRYCLTSGGRIGIALPSGFIADRYLGGASGGLRAGLFGVAVFAGLAVALTLSGGGAAGWPWA